MFPIDLQHSPTARHFRILLTCDQCGCQSLETLTRLHGRHQLSCRECLTTLDLGDKENRVFVEEAVELCRRADAKLQKLGKAKRH
jgi:hypothetical protein